jgi:hypothetical protein
MRTILIIPDTHGRKFWRKALEIIDEVDKVIFLGDYLDPYDVSEEECLIEFKEIVEFKLKYPDKVILLIGNHDCEYIWPQLFANTCRHCYSIEKEAQELFLKVNLSLVYEEDKYLFSHAGVLKGWLDFTKLTIENLTNNLYDPLVLKMASWLRSGLYRYPSCVWCDVREFKSELPYYQIFGHTQLIKEYITDEFACLDARKCFLLKNEELSCI